MWQKLKIVLVIDFFHIFVVYFLKTSLLVTPHKSKLCNENGNQRDDVLSQIWISEKLEYKRIGIEHFMCNWNTRGSYYGNDGENGM